VIIQSLKTTGKRKKALMISGVSVSQTIGFYALIAWNQQKYEN
jgi:hypothetical protein